MKLVVWKIIEGVKFCTEVLTLLKKRRHSDIFLASKIITSSSTGWRWQIQQKWQNCLKFNRVATCLAYNFYKSYKKHFFSLSAKWIKSHQLVFFSKYGRMIILCITVVSVYQESWISGQKASKDGPENIFCVSVRARIGRATLFWCF